jgi:hypothetical protein
VVDLVLATQARAMELVALMDTVAALAVVRVRRYMPNLQDPEMLVPIHQLKGMQEEQL